MGKVFHGFPNIKKNYSRLPHALIEALPLIETGAEMKVILYVLRHTWGFQDDKKRITLDEFQNGRKRKKKPRIDNGVGMCRNSIKDGIQRAIKHGFLHVEEDASDGGRIKRWYSLIMLEDSAEDEPENSQKVTPTCQEVTSRSPENDPRTEKETLEINSRNDHAAPSAGADDQRVEDIEPEDAPEADCPHCAESIVIANLKSSSAECPHCRGPLRVVDVNGRVLKKPPLRYRRRKKKVLADIFPDCPERFVNLPFKAGDRERIVQLPRAALLSSLTWATDKWLAGEMARIAVVGNACTAAANRAQATGVTEDKSSVAIEGWVKWLDLDGGYVWRPPEWRPDATIGIPE